MLVGPLSFPGQPVHLVTILRIRLTVVVPMRRGHLSTNVLQVFLPMLALVLVLRLLRTPFVMAFVLRIMVVTTH